MLDAWHSHRPLTPSTAVDARATTTSPRSQLDLFEHLIEVVGDADALWRLDTDPLPDEPFDWSAVDPADVPFVEEVLALSDEWLRRDARTSSSARSPGASSPVSRLAIRCPFRRSPHAARCAASLVWLAGQVNGGFCRQRPALRVVGVDVVRRRELRRTWSQPAAALRASSHVVRLSRLGWAVG